MLTGAVLGLLAAPLTCLWVNAGTTPMGTILSFGDMSGEPPATTTENGDLVAYWRPDPEYPNDFMDAVGAAVKQASKHLATVLASLQK